MARKKKALRHAAMAGWLVRLGKQVSDRRESLDLKQDALAERLKISRDTLSAIENGSRSYTVEPLLQVLVSLYPDPPSSLMEMTKNLDGLDAAETDAVGDLIAVLISDDSHERETVIRILKGSRKALQQSVLSGGKGRKRTS